MLAGCRGGPGCRWMGGSRFQVGAVREILRRSEHIANIAILPSAAAAASQRAGTSDAGAAAPMTPILDGLGNLAELAPVSSAALPEVGYSGSRQHAACMLASLSEQPHRASVNAVGIWTTDKFDVGMLPASRAGCKRVKD